MTDIEEICSVIFKSVTEFGAITEYRSFIYGNTWPPAFRQEPSRLYAD
jgi:hypothetical protein